MSKGIRCQGAIIKDHHILCLNNMFFLQASHVGYFPGGGFELGETEEDCVHREMKEETNLETRVISLLLDQPARPEDRLYSRARTYLCEPLSGDASPGYDPEYHSKEPEGRSSICSARG